MSYDLGGESEQGFYLPDEVRLRRTPLKLVRVSNLKWEGTPGPDQTTLKVLQGREPITKQAITEYVTLKHDRIPLDFTYEELDTAVGYNEGDEVFGSST